MGIEFEDLSIDLPTSQNVADARNAVHTAMVRHIASLPPELAVKLGNIDRCLKVAEMVIQKFESS